MGGSGTERKAGLLYLSFTDMETIEEGGYEEALLT